MFHNVLKRKIIKCRVFLIKLAKICIRKSWKFTGIFSLLPTATIYQRQVFPHMNTYPKLHASLYIRLRIVIPMLIYNPVSRIFMFTD